MKDYYEILGVIRTAEDIVIKAAYRALAQKYHPDKFKGQQEEAQLKMQEINEAYAVLSDSEKRKEYDSTYEYQPEDGFESPESDQATDFDDQNKVWSEILEYFPDLEVISAELAKISKRLVQTFKYQLIETKDFKNRAPIAKAIENLYLESYFGTNKELAQFGKLLILCKLKDAALKLNRAANILGSNVEASVVINKIYTRDLSQEERVLISLLEKQNPSILKIYANKNFSENFNKFDARNFIRKFGGELNWVENFDYTYYVSASNSEQCKGNFEFVVALCRKLVLLI